MANNVISIAIWTASGTTPVLATSGSYDLRVSPFSATGIVGVHQGAGIWNFTGIDDTAEYKLYNTTAGTEVVGFTGGGTNTRVFFDSDLQTYLKLAGGTMSGAIAMGGSKITGAGAATANGDLTRWEQVGVLNQTRTISGQWVFTTHPSASPGASTFPPTATGHYTPKWYVDGLFATATGIRQSSYLIKCLPTSTSDDSYSSPTPEGCNTYLSGLANIGTYRGTMLIEALGQAGNAINLDDGTNQWISDGVDIVGLNRPTLTRRGYNSSLTFLTSYGSLRGVKIVDDTQVSARTYINFVFNDCFFYVDQTEMAFTTCKFYNCVFRFDGGEAVTFSNCTGSGITYNDDADVTFSGTQPANVVSTNVNNIGF